jgi:hypothetical protein
MLWTIIQVHEEDTKFDDVPYNVEVGKRIQVVGVEPTPRGTQPRTLP